MKHTFIMRFLSISLLIALFVSISLAQVESSGCHPDFRDRIGETASEIDFDAMCDVYIECLSTDSLDCILLAFEVAFLSCDGVDACENEAILYTATIDLFNHPYLNHGVSLDMIPIDEVVEGLTFVQAEQYKSALVSYNSITDYGHPMIPMSMGHLYSLMGDSEKAIEQYNLASQSINEPITYFARAREYAHLDVNLALLDMNIFFDLVLQADVPELQATFAPIMEEPTLDSVYEQSDWLLYPTKVYIDGYDGTEMTDLSAEVPTEVALYQIDKETIILSHVPFKFGNFLSPTILRLQLNKKGEYKLWGLYFHQSGTDPMTLVLQYDEFNNHYEGHLQMIYFNELMETHFILAPEDQPDPR